MSKLFITIIGFISIAVSFLIGETQTIELEYANWNMISFYVLPENLDIQDIFQPVIDSGNLISIYEGSQLDSLKQVDGEWVNTIGDIDPKWGYSVYVNQSVTLTIEGDPVELPLAIILSGSDPAGMSTIGYPFNVAQPVTEVFEYINSLGVLILVANGNGQYYMPNFNVNTVVDLEPGQGYRVSVFDSVLFHYCEPGTDCNCTLGDVNIDNEINVVDIISTVNCILNGTGDCSCADMNLDGRIDIIDIVLMVNTILGNE
ncbi:MAG: hypothetical protein HQ510_01335 [Candidatus Marinimicrobia bacterium]|nr:hypothetical protein [Candidatus Neomarinimicrobiota bacterium]